MVIRHPISGRYGLYVNRGFILPINDLPKEESDAQRGDLFQHTKKPDFQMRFQSQPNSVAFWDNRAVQHLAVWDYFSNVRSVSRVTIKGQTLAA